MENKKDTIIKLESSDGQIFEIKEKCFLRSYYYKIFKDILNPNEEIPFSEINGKSLSKIIEYLNHYENEDPKEIPKPLPGPDIKPPVLDQWDYDFISILPLEEVIDLINTANFLGINELTTLGSARAALEMINCDVDEAREKFGIIQDMTQEEIDEANEYPLD